MKKHLLKPLLTLALVLICGSVWAEKTTIASWGKVSLAKDTPVKATGGDADNMGKATLTSPIAVTSSGTDAYYSSSWTAGSSIVLANLTATDYQNIEVSFYSRGSKTGTITVSYTEDGSTYNTLSNIGVSKSETKYTITGIPATTKGLNFAYGAAGSFYFGTVTVSGESTSTVTLTSIALSGDLTKKTYDDGDMIDFAGITATGNYSDGTTKDLTSLVKFTSTPEVLTTGTTEVSIQATYTVSSGSYKVTGLTVNKAYKDVLDPATVSNPSSYSNWTYKGTYASYAGFSTGSTSNLQLKSADNVSGIVTTSSTSTIKKISVSWNSSTASGRTLNVYGSNEPYTAVSDLYSTEKQGTLLGTIVYDTSTELVITDEYKYVGVRSNSGALYLNDIKFSWAEPKTLSSLAVKTNPTTTSYKLGDELDATGLVLTGKYSDSSTEDFTYTEATKGDYTFTGYDMSTASAQTVIVTYRGKTTTFDISVISVTLESITIDGTLTKSEYVEGEEIDPTGLTVTGYYSDDSHKDLTSEVEWSYNVTTMELGTTSVNITATYNGLSDTNTFTGLTVSPKTKYHLVTDASTLKTGDVIVLGCAGKNKAAGPMDGKFLSPVEATITNGVLTSPDAIEITLGGESGAWTLTTSEGRLTTKAEKALVLDGTTGYTTTCTITIDNANAGITFGTYGSIQYNNSSPRFVNYASSQTAIQIYKKEPYYNVKVAAMGWATACLPFNAKITSTGAKAYYVTGIDGISLVKAEAAVIPAGEGILINLDGGGEVTFEASDEDPDDASANLLEGSLVAKKTFEEQANTTYYILSVVGDVPGFYWDNTTNDNGATASCNPGKAVLVVEGSTGSNVFSLNHDATGITIIEQTEGAIYYNLLGQKVANPATGIYILNGKKVYVK